VNSAVAWMQRSD